MTVPKTAAVPAVGDRTMDFLPPHIAKVAATPMTDELLQIVDPVTGDIRIVDRGRLPAEPVTAALRRGAEEARAWLDELWRPADRRLVSAEIARLGLHFRPPDLDENQWQILLRDYVDELQEFPAPAIVEACRQYRRTARFWPRLAELIELAEEARERLRVKTHRLARSIDAIDNAARLQVTCSTEARRQAQADLERQAANELDRWQPWLDLFDTASDQDRAHTARRLQMLAKHDGEAIIRDRLAEARRRQVDGRELWGFLRTGETVQDFEVWKAELRAEAAGECAR